MVFSRVLKRIFFKIKAFVYSRFGTGIASARVYSSYKDYVNYQKIKTTDPLRIKKWLGEEWEIKVERFMDMFNRNSRYIKDKQLAICLGSRAGQEVKALQDMGISAIGIDLVPFEPYTIEGDIHDLHFEDNYFDLVFTNIFDHSLYPYKFSSEMERITRPGGVIIIHLQVGIRGDEYTETFVYNPRAVTAMFKLVEIEESRSIRNKFYQMNWELILRKI